MKLITKNTDYAIRALMYIALRNNRYVSSREIADEELIPLAFLRRLLQRMSREDIITTREGANGGIKLMKPAEEIRITDLIRLFQGDLQLVDCLFRKQICRNREHCVLRKRIKQIEEKVISELEDITIGSLVADLQSLGN